MGRFFLLLLFIETGILLGQVPLASSQSTEDFTPEPSLSIPQSFRQQIDDLLHLGLDYIEVGDYDNAIATYQQAAILDDENPKIFSGIGYLYTLQGNFLAASEAYQKALYIDPNNPDFYYALGYSLASAGKYSDAATAYYSAIGLEPENVKHYIGLGVVLLRQQDYIKAEEIYQSIIALDPNNQEAYEIMGKALVEQQRFPDAIVFLETSLHRFPYSTELRLQLASVKFNQGEVTEALDLLKQAERVSQNNYKVFLKTGIILEKQNLLEDALTAYRRAIYLNSQSIEAKAGIGRILLAKQDYLGATVVYKELLEIMPNNGDAYYGLALSYQGRGLKREAKQALETARQLYYSNQNQNGIQQVDSLSQKL
jgi:tetratricopeptide (TPR) repeat protein